MLCFPLQSAESKVTQLILKDTSIWLKMRYLNSIQLSRLHHHWLQLQHRRYSRCGHKTIQLTLNPAATSTKQQWQSASSLTHHWQLLAAPSTRCHHFLSWICKRSSANYLMQIFHETQQCSPCEWVTHVWITCTLMSGYEQGLRRTDIKSRKHILQIMHILIQNNSYKQYSFLKASMVI